MYGDQNENPYDYVAPRSNYQQRSQPGNTQPSQNSQYARPYIPDKHSREGSYDRGRTFMNQIYMDHQELEKLRNQESANLLRDSGYPSPDSRPRWEQRY